MRYEYFAKQMAEDYVKRGIANGDTFPDMELYIDQMVASLNKELALFAQDEKGPVTKAMVSNYTKHKMIPGPDGKKYSKAHLYFMTMVFYLKNVLSMDQIQMLMAPVIENFDSEWDDKMSVERAFHFLMEALKEDAAGLPADIDALTAAIKKNSEDAGEEDDTLELITMIFTLIMRSNAERYVAEKLLQEYFEKKK